MIFIENILKKKKKLKVSSRSALRKKYVGSDTASNIVVAAEDMLWLPSRFIALNDLLGGGIPFGKILEIFGEESSGKSLLAYDFAYCCQRLGGVVMWNDAEHAFTESWALQNGLDLDMVELYTNKSIENLADWAMDMAISIRQELKSSDNLTAKSKVEPKFIIAIFLSLESLINELLPSSIVESFFSTLAPGPDPLGYLMDAGP